MPPPPRFAKADLALAGVCLCWGTGPLAMAETVERVPPATAQALRFLIAGALLAAFLRWRGHALPSGAGAWGRQFLVSAANLIVAQFLFIWCLQYVPSALAAIITATLPFFLVAMAAIAGRTVPPWAWAGLGIGLAGMLLLFWPDLSGLWTDNGTAHGDRFWIGTGLLFLVALIWASGAFMINAWTFQVSPFMGSAIQCIIAGIAMVPLSFLLGEWPRIEWTWQGAAGIAWMVTVLTWGGYGLFVYMMGKLPPARASIYGYGAPLIAVLLGWLVRGEDFGPWRIAGSAAILLGVAITTTANGRAKDQPARGADSP
ncbi:MAG: EamA family transporter [Sumerlaeia bacterium]